MGVKCPTSEPVEGDTLEARWKEHALDVRTMIAVVDHIAAACGPDETRTLETRDMYYDRLRGKQAQIGQHL